MFSKTEFNPKHQFHVLLSFKDEEHSVAIVPDLPNHLAGRFLIVDQGKVLGQIFFNEKKACVGVKGNIAPAIVSQLETNIKQHYYYS